MAEHSPKKIKSKDLQFTVNRLDQRDVSLAIIFESVLIQGEPAYTEQYIKDFVELHPEMKFGIKRKKNLKN